MIAVEIVTCIEPFSELGENISPLLLIQKVTNGYRPKFSQYVTDKMKELITRCWSESPENRPTFKEIFDLLSTDLTYFKEDIDKKEIQNCIKQLSESGNEQPKDSDRSTNDKKVADLQKEIDNLKIKMSKLQKENDTFNESCEHLYKGLVSLLGVKKTTKFKQSSQ